MNSGTSKIWLKSGPGDLLIITKMLHKIQENMESSWENIIYVNLGLKQIEHFRENVCPKYHMFSFVYLCFSFFCVFGRTHLKTILRR